MSAKNQNNEINQGSHRVLNFTTSGSGLDLATALALVYVIATSASSAPLLTKTLGDGVAQSTSTQGTIAFVPSDTAGLAGTYWHEMRATNADGQTDLLFTGTIIILENVTG